MADQTVVYQEPTDTSDGLTVTISRGGGSASIVVTYVRSGRLFGLVTLRLADFTAAQRNQMQTVIGFIVTAAKTAMGF